MGYFDVYLVSGINVNTTNENYGQNLPNVVADIIKNLYLDEIVMVFDINSGILFARIIHS